LKQNSLENHYLIITTNFDTLMEKALSKYNLTYAVITTNTRFGEENYGKVDIRFYGDIKNEEEIEKKLSNVVPKNFIIEGLEKAIVLIYKIHGDLNEELTPVPKDDSLVITDSDYISFISRMADNSNGAIPGYVDIELKKRQILFLGYSFRDWNIRSVLMKMRDQRKHLEDYMVVDNATDAEIRTFDREFKLSVIKMDIFRFIERLS